MFSSARFLTVAAKPSSLRDVRDFVREGAIGAKLPEARMGELDLLVEELLMNVCAYAYPNDRPGDVTVSYSVPGPGELSIELADQGAEFNPLKMEQPDLTLSLEARPVGGLGIHLVKTFAKSLSYRREQGWNRLTFGFSAGS
ncbi:MAG TPA: ATP-binding protein [Bryobacteraceae bacterium]|nr:ATP-binding protein [Bryobacteraceae bacterium]